MAVLNIRNLPDDVHERLRIREEMPPFNLTALQDWVDQFYGGHKPSSVVDEFIRERRAEAARE